MLDPKKARRRARAALQKALLRAERAKADEGLAACLPLMAALQGPGADAGAAAGAGAGGGSGSEVRACVRPRGGGGRVRVSPRWAAGADCAIWGSARRARGYRTRLCTCSCGGPQARGVLTPYA